MTRESSRLLKISIEFNYSCDERTYEVQTQISKVAQVKSKAVSGLFSSAVFTEAQIPAL